MTASSTDSGSTLPTYFISHGGGRWPWRKEEMPGVHDRLEASLRDMPAITLAELAAEISRQSGREVVYRDLPAEAYAEALVGLGLPEPFARVLADSDLGIKRGDLFTDSGDLRRLIGRPTTTLADAVAAAFKEITL